MLGSSTILNATACCVHTFFWGHRTTWNCSASKFFFFCIIKTFHNVPWADAARSMSLLLYTRLHTAQSVYRWKAWPMFRATDAWHGIHGVHDAIRTYVEREATIRRELKFTATRELGFMHSLSLDYIALGGFSDHSCVTYIFLQMCVLWRPGRVINCFFLGLLASSFKSSLLYVSPTKN